MDIDYKMIGSRIRAQRNLRGYTQENLAEKLDVTIGYVSQVERGVTKVSLDLLARISTVLECDIGMFVTGAAVDTGIYMREEFVTQFARLNGRDKKIVIELIKMLAER